MSYEEFNALNYSQIRQLLETVIPIAKNRYEMMKNHNLNSPARTSIEKHNDGDFRIPKDFQKARAELAFFKNLLNDKTFTISGAKKLEADRYQAALKVLKANKYGWKQTENGTIRYTKENLSELFKLWDRLKEESNEIFAFATQTGDSKQLLRELGKIYLMNEGNTTEEDLIVRLKEEIKKLQKQRG